MITLRPYQQEAVDKTIEWVKKSTLPCLSEMSVGAGKSIYIAEVARIIHEMSGKRILCLAPRSELVIQNQSKYTGLGLKASIYSASAKQKSLRHPVVFATPMTFKPVARRLGSEFAAVIIDECEGTTPVIREIIEDMKKGSPNLRVIGTTGTPFTTTDGYVYREDENGRALPENIARDPYYAKKLYTVSTRQLLDAGYLTPAIVGDTGRDSYDALSLTPNKAGKFAPGDVDRVFVGHGRKTAAIVADAMDRMAGRKSIVFFAATIKHAEEIYASLHPGIAAVVHGKTKDRDKILEKFGSGGLRVLINVNVLTVGWDCPRVDGIVLMRATESARLLAQIIGRGLRLFEGKEDVLLLDYAKNFERHAEDGDIFNPSIKASYKGEEGEPIEAICESCERVNIFSARRNEEGFNVDANGYFTDLTGERIQVENHKGESVPLAAHYGRRCQHVHMRTGERCDYYWSCKVCPVCDHANDIAARFCSACKCELIDPASKLIEMHQAHKKDPTKPQTEEVLGITYTRGVSRSGNDMITAEVTTPRRKFPIYLLESTNWQAQKRMAFALATDDFTTTPRTITYVKKGDFWEALGFGAPTDDEQLQQRLIA
jgi:DNA repair protein RadD